MALDDLLPSLDYEDNGLSLLPGQRTPRPVAPPAKQGISFINDILPSIITGFSGGMAARQRDPEALMRIVSTFMQAKELKRRAQLQESAQQLREEREARLAEMAQNNENLRLRTQQETERRTGETEKRQKSNDLNTLINTIEDNMRSTLGDRMQDPAAVDTYIAAQSARIGAAGGDAAAAEKLLRSIATQGSQPNKQVPLRVLQPGETPPASVEKGTIVRNAPQPRREPPPPADAIRAGVNPATGKPELFARDRQGTVKWLGIAPPKTGGNDALDRIIQEATGGRGAGAGAGAGTPQQGKSVTAGELAAIAKKRGTTVEEERKRATAAGFIVR